MKHSATRAVIFLESRKTERGAKHLLTLSAVRATPFALVLLAVSGWAQSSAPLKFEVSTVKPNSTDDHRMMMQVQPGGMLHASGVTLMMLITQAYNVRDFQVSGGPKWLATDRFDIVAKAEGAPDRIPFEQFRPMLAGLIEDRFQLKFHRETKEMPEYALVVGKNGAKMQANASEAGPQNGPQMRMGRGQLTGKKIPMTMLAQQLSQQLGRTVVDKTGLTGDFDFELNWTPEPGQGGFLAGPPGPGGPEGPPPADPNGPSIFTAVQEQLGLKLESEKGQVEVLVLDRAERPTEN